MNRGDPDVETIRFAGRDGIMLVGDRRGDPEQPPVVFLHGGGQTRHAWQGAATAVAARGWQAIAMDLRGHGESAWSDVGDYRLISFAEDLKMIVESLSTPPVLVGASLGGLTSILLTGELAPAVARAVVLVDIVPDMEPAGASRVQSFMLDRAAEGFGSLEEVADAIAAYNPHRPKPSDLTGLRKNLRERGGRYFWHWDPRFMADTSPYRPTEVTDVPRLEAAVARMIADAPVMLVRGRSSDLVSEAKATEFCLRYPSVEFVDVSGAGHMVAGDRNDAFISGVLTFLDRLPR